MENICSLRVFRILSQNGHPAFAKPLIGAILVVTLGRTIFNDNGLIAGSSDR